MDYEKLGVFYLGRPYDLKAGKRLDTPLLYDSRDLVTHALCVGMTGSGKTGLCIGLLEEAAIDGVPAIVIDPKGDLPNLLLTFPELKPEEFAPWVNPDDAARKGLTPEQFAAEQADTWRNGLADWDQQPERIARLKASAEFRIYTPGSTAGRSVSILKSFDRPGAAVMDDPELLQDLVRTTVTGLLGLVGVDADPLQSREHILLSAIINDAWASGKALNLENLIASIQKPPVKKIGVMDLDSVFPVKDRTSLALRLNNLIAAPGFQTWLTGEPMDVGAFLRSESGKPVVSIFSIAHLSDSERMFFVTMLLNQVLGWTRTQSGTTSLRAILYMDEIFGYFPPVANPPSKAPLLTLLKQARAFGVGVVLATQNPVDLDYKGLSNCGTWYIGRLQTDRDKLRVLDGLEGAAASAASTFDRQSMEQTLAGLKSRVFLMNNVHEDAPLVFQTRWTLSYLRGPLTRQQIRKLAASDPGMKPGDAQTPGQDSAEPAKAKPLRPAAAGDSTDASSDAGGGIPPDLRQWYLPATVAGPADGTLVYRPMAGGLTDVVYSDAKTGINARRSAVVAAPIVGDPPSIDFAAAVAADIHESSLRADALSDAAIEPPHRDAFGSAAVSKWPRQLVDSAYRTVRLSILRSDAIKQMSRPGESERDFRARLSQEFREHRDDALAALRAKYAPKAETLDARIAKAETARDVQKEQANSAQWSTAVSFGTTVLGALLGRRKVSTGTVTRAGTAARGVNRSMKERQDVQHAQETIESLEQQREQLEQEFQAESQRLSAELDPSAAELSTLSIRPKKADIQVRYVAVFWMPFWKTPTAEVPAWG